MMKTTVELFLVAPVKGGFHWLRKAIDISQEQQDPDTVATHFLDYFFCDTRSVTEKERYILHSTSWRYEPRDYIVLTYIAFAETFRFEHLSPGFLQYKEMSVVSGRNPKIPRPKGRLLPEQILSHGMRHIAYLVAHDADGIFSSVISAETKAMFVKVHGTLAGRLLRE
jgi:hypothetical protein